MLLCGLMVGISSGRHTCFLAPKVPVFVSVQFHLRSSTSMSCLAHKGATELLVWWSNLRESEDHYNVFKHIIWNNKRIKIEGKSVFYKHYFDKDIKHTSDLIYSMSNIESFNVVRDAGLTRSNFLVWTGLRQSVPPKLRVNVPNFKVVFDLENFKCHNYYSNLIKQKCKKPSKWAKLREEINLEDKQVSEVFLLLMRVANEPFLRSFQYKVLNSILLYRHECFTGK